MGEPTDTLLGESALDPTHFETLVGAHLGKPEASAALHQLLLRMRDTKPTFGDRSAWLEELADWIHGGRPSDDVRTGRFRALILALAAVRGFREEFAALLTGVVHLLRGTKLFADVGLPVEAGFWREALDRVSRWLLPSLPAPRSFTEFIARLFPTEAEAEWLERCPVELWQKLWAILEGTQAPLSTAWMPLAGSMADATRILAVRIAALGVAQDVRDRLPEVPIASLPFLRLPALCDAVQLGPPRHSMSNEGAIEMIAECRRALDLVHAHIEESGVSVDLVYRLELMGAQLDRLNRLLVFLVPHSTEALAGNLGRFGLDLVRAQFQGSSVLELLRTSLHLLARKVVERSGKSGEHYITETFAEWRTMLLSAAGGGFLTAFTAAIKILTSKLGLPVLIASLASSVNYAGSFLLMGALGFTLATKQPSMTAAALAASLESEEGAPPDVEGLVTLIAQISRSQLAAAAGNVGMVIPTALAFDWVWQRATGHPFLSVEKAGAVVESLVPIRGGTVFYAAFTGVLLWVSSLGAGALENWIVYRRLPEAIAKNRRVKRALGPDRARRFAAAVEHGAASVGGSITLGVLLGSMPTLGVLLGLPIDVRHVTLSTGSLVFAGTTLGAVTATQSTFLLAAFGIVIIGALNFGVSFVLALGVALRARPRWPLGAEHLLPEVLRAFGRRLRRRPLEFVLPPRSSRERARRDAP